MTVVDAHAHVFAAVSDRLPRDVHEDYFPAGRFPRVFVLLIGMYAFAAEPCPYGDLRPVVAVLLAAFGPERLLLGSDFPWIREVPGYAEALAAVDSLLGGLDDAGRARVRGGKALELLR